MNKYLVAALKVLAYETLNLGQGYKLKQIDKTSWGLLSPSGELLLTHGHEDSEPDEEAFIYTHLDDDKVITLATNGLPKDLRRKGLATSAYKALAKHYGVIRSDASLSEDAANLWRSLVKKHGAKVISWDTKDYDLYKYYNEDEVHPEAKYDPDTYYIRYQLEK